MGSKTPDLLPMCGQSCRSCRDGSVLCSLGVHLATIKHVSNEVGFPFICYGTGADPGEKAGCSVHSPPKPHSGPLVLQGRSEGPFSV